MLYFIGLGINGYSGISLSAKETLQKCNFIYIERFTSYIDDYDIKQLELLLDAKNNKKMKIVPRWFIEDAREIIYQSKEKGVKTNFIIEDFTEPFEADYSSPLVRSLVLSVLDVCKKRPMLLRKTGTGDMNIIGNAFKIPVVTYGPGDPHSSHSINEHIRIDEYLSGIEVFKRSLFHMSRIHHTQKK